MQENDQEEMAEKTLASGYTITIAHSTNGRGYDVDCWKPDGTNHWNRFYLVEADAKAEYDRWN